MKKKEHHQAETTKVKYTVQSMLTPEIEHFLYGTLILILALFRFGTT